MPLIRIDAVEGRTDSEVKALLDAVHRAVVKAFYVRDRDRYQIYQGHSKAHFVVQDTGLGIVRTDKVTPTDFFPPASKSRECSTQAVSLIL